MSLKQLATTQYIPALRDAGIDHLVGAAEAGSGLQVSRSFALVGASPHTISFSALETQGGNPFHAPIDLDYIPMVVGATAARVDLPSRTLGSFTITGGTAADVVAIVLHARFGNMKR